MTQAHTDWFYNTNSDNQLRQILSDYSKDYTGYRQYVTGGRCTLADALEKLDAQVKRMTPAQRAEACWS